MKKVIIIICFIASYAFAQNMELQHYQRSIDIKELHLPGQIFVPSDYGIFFPDSLYQTASLTIRKVKHRDFNKSFTMFAYVKNGEYQAVRLLVKNKKTLNALIKEINQRFPESGVRNEANVSFCLTNSERQIMLNINQLGSRKELHFILQKCNQN